MKTQEKATIIANRRVKGDYFRVDVAAESVAGTAGPGQFVHVRFPALQHRILRRPFSIFDTDPDHGVVSVIYKVVGEGTAHLAQLSAGADLDLLGPLGVGFSTPDPDDCQIIVAGGYGAAATYKLAKACVTPPMVLIGGRSVEDLLLVKEYRDLGADVRTSTDDGSDGQRGVVTDLLRPALADIPAASQAPKIAACGPNAMLKAVASLLDENGLDGEISLDHVMCCGVGACFACVVKMRTNDHDGWEYVRTCMAGPVFRASSVCWE